MTVYESLPLMLGVPDLAKLWGCSERVAAEWCADNAWHPDNKTGVAFKVGRSWQVPRDAVLPPPAGSPEVDALREENQRLREQLVALRAALASIQAAATAAKDTAA